MFAYETINDEIVEDNAPFSMDVIGTVDFEFWVSFQPTPDNGQPYSWNNKNELKEAIYVTDEWQPKKLEGPETLLFWSGAPLVDSRFYDCQYIGIGALSVLRRKGSNKPTRLGG